MSRAATLEAPAADRIVTLGDNNPPPETAPDPFDAITAHGSDLYTETGNWADGAEIQNAAEMAEVERLIDAWKDLIDLAQATQDAEIKPLADKVQAIREKWYPLIADTKKLTGIAVRAKAVLLQVKSRYAVKLEAIAQAEAKRLRDLAAEEALKASQAARDAIGNLEATEQAEDLIKAAQATQRAVKQAEAPAIKGMRDNWQVTGFADNTGEDGAVISGKRELILFYMKRRPDDVLEACLQLAREDVRNGIRVIPGVTIENLRKAV